MHVLVIPSWFAHYQGDPSGSFFATQASGVHELGEQVGMIYPDLRSLRHVKKYLRSKTTWSSSGGVNIFRKTYINWTPRIERLILPKWVAAGMQLFDGYCARFGKPDVIHAHCLLRAGVLAAAIFRKHGIPYVVTEHSSQWHKHEVSPYEMLPARQAAKNAKVVISVSNALLTHMRQDMELTHTHVVPNAVDPVFFATEIRDQSNKKKLTFINVALLNPSKRQDILIDAFFHAFGKETPHLLYIVGDGPERIALEQRISRYGMGASIQLLGMQPKNRVAGLLDESDCFVLTSDNETFGVVVTEALAKGLPVISTKCGGTDDIVTMENGLMTEAGNLHAVAEAMTTMSQRIESGFYNRKQIRDGCINDFSQLAVCSKLVKIYASAAKQIDSISTPPDVCLQQ
ncbi:glycosyltransferase [Janthinobacterium aquaticum]|uniref:glycosyltransferase n=1 Tax=Janthinobacterium sp. FT58W TaxID=2654254 RepID=UPI00126471BB|nr:glycosyltransferase [Janthinobacterium sp. FT58W]KAB8044003.1 glycosyltransferase [Janthinobacterium sp. FT58W]